jgi:hypothetical protein
LATVVKVFLGSPGDLSSERAIVRARAEHFNRLWSDAYDIHFRVVGWEDAPPVARRPQARINQDADGCDLFIGLLGARWGSDSGMYSSGFEEEYTSAHARWTSGGAPEIALLFKTVSTAQLEDPGPQLRRVLEFRQSIIDGKEIFFKDFTDATQLSNAVDSVFAEYAQNRERKRAGRSEGLPQTPQSDSSDEGQTLEADASSISAVISTVDAATPSQAAGRLDFWSKLRLLLFSLSAYSEFQEHAVLHTHDANLVFRRRKSWVLGELEELNLIRSMLRDSNRYTPGWYWLAHGDPERARERLWLFCRFDRHSKKRAAALLAHDLTLPGDPDIVRESLRDPETAPSISELVGRLGDSSWLPFIAEARQAAGAAGAEVGHLATAEFDIRVREQGTMPLEDLEAFTAVGVSAAITGLSARLADMDDAQVAIVLSRLKGRPRSEIVRQLSDAKRLTKEMAKSMLSDADARVRESAVRTLIAYGQVFDRTELTSLFPSESPSAVTGLLSLASIFDRVDVSELIRLDFRLLTFEQLMASADFFELDGRAAVEALVQIHWADYQAQLAAHLDSAFDDLREAADARNLDTMGVTLSSIWSANRTSDLIEYIRGQFLEAALQGVRQFGHERAREWANKYTDTRYPERVRELAFGILFDLGEAFDRVALVREFSTLPPSAAARVLPQIFAQIPFDADLFELLASHASEILHDEMKRHLACSWQASYSTILEGFMTSSTARIRLLAAKILLHNLNELGLEQLLDRYIELTTYYYDVVVIFDETLYGASPFVEGKARVGAGKTN